MATFRTGADEAERAAEKAKGGSFSAVEYFSIKKGQYPNDTVDVRLLTDFRGDNAWITVAQHASLPTRPAPEGYKGNWPQFMTGVCRKDMHDGVRTFPEFEDCWACDVYRDKDGKPAKKSDRTWGLGILREEVIADGKRIGLKDRTREVTFTKEDGTTETRTEPHYVVFSMAWSNFWSPIKAVGDMKGTVLDRDFRIKRVGFDMNDTDYQIASHDPVNVTMPDGSIRVLDFRDPEILAFYPNIPDLGEFVTKRASDEHYHRFFDTRFPQPTFGKEEKAAPVGAQAPATEPPAGAAEAIAQRLQGVAQGITGYGPQAAPATVAGAGTATATAEPGLTPAPLPVAPPVAGTLG